MTAFIIFFVILSLFNPMVKMVPIPNEMTLIENPSTSNNSIGLFINVPKLKKIIKIDLKFEILEDSHIFMDLINKTSDESEIPNLKSELDTKIFNAINGSINEKDLTTSTSASTVEEETTRSTSTTTTSTSTTTSTTTPTMRRGILEEEEEETTTTTAATTLKRELLEEDTTTKKTATNTTSETTTIQPSFFDFNSENESVDHIENKNIGDEKSEKMNMGINDSEREFENVSRAPTFINTSQEFVLGISDSDTEFESVSRVPIKRNTTHKLESTENMHNSQIEFTKRGIIENFKQKQGRTL